MNSTEPAIINKVKRDLHTLKGESRTHGLSKLNDAVHAIETNKLKGNSEEFSASLKKGRQVVNNYRTILIKQFFKVLTSIRQEHEKFEKLVERIEQEESLEDLKSYVQSIHYLPLRSIIKEIRENTGQIAAGIGKSAPNIQFLGHENTLFDPKSFDLIKSVFVHIFRNSIDHGIETDEQRRKHKKPVPGTIELVMTKHENGIAISVSDDGAGLNMQKLRAKAKDKNIDPNDNLALANQIFESGMSTAANINDISGMGIGMDAVKHALEEANGHLSLKLIGEENENRQGFELVIQLPEQCLGN